METPLFGAVMVFTLSAGLIAVFGSVLSKLADRLADATGMGEALMGGIFLGSMTSLSGITSSVTAAAEAHAHLSFSNAVGGLAVQTAFLPLADLAYRKVNLEHAAASLSNIMQAALLIALLALPLLAATGPDLSVLSVHPVSLVLVAAYVLGMRQIARSGDNPMWAWKHTPETRPDVPKHQRETARALARLWAQFAGCSVVIVIAGYAIAQSGITIAAQTGLSEGFVGAVFTGVFTSLPELVTSVSAVRTGALTLAVGGIVGGNCFDVLFLSFSDIAYREGSLYHAVGQQQLFLVSLTILLNCIILMGLLHREKRGIANIGWESILVLIAYALGSSEPPSSSTRKAPASSEAY